MIENDISKHFRLKTAQTKGLSALGIKTIRDLLYHLPFRYSTYTGGQSVRDVTKLKKNDKISLSGRITAIKMRRAFRKRTMMSEATLATDGGNMKVLWFNQPYISKQYPKGSIVKLSGTVGGSEGKLFLSNPDISNADLIGEMEQVTSREEEIISIYPESKGITSLWFRGAIKSKILPMINDFPDPVPDEIIKKYSLPTRYEAMIYIHAPRTKKDIEVARKRFSFDEIFFLQVAKQRDRQTRSSKSSFKIDFDKEILERFLEKMPFKPTNAQLRVIDDISKDMKKNIGMSRLLQGDVGSGKTMVAAASASSVINSRPPNQDYGRLQVAYMAPTEILAIQQFEVFVDMFKDLPISMGLITSKICRKFPSKVDKDKSTKISKKQMTDWVKNGEIAIVVGTHSLLQKNISFKNLAYVIVDEQHRFGVAQRKNIARKDDIAPHFLSMSATPIPRTLALTIYGDLDISTLDELPPNRGEVATEIINSESKKEVEGIIEKEVSKGRQVYVVCPRILQQDDDAVLKLRSVSEEAKHLKKILPKLAIEELHGQMKPNKKAEIIENFLDGKIDVLVTTTVVEVGVNVPNATVMVIENAERFGLAQLHQLRGRILRSEHSTKCFAVTKTQNDISLERLKAFASTSDGFKLAEKDYKLRGSGELFGVQQSGISDFAMEALKNKRLVEHARTEAGIIIEKDSELANHKAIAEEIERRTSSVHFE
ncbi:MAG: ATP-dependent DNA helicase RecG [Candidatus Campbellbacteria bacterium]|nr:ATP-dependent DNA helicase RecG [Candidatus Campbellbacteria bacterium]